MSDDIGKKVEHVTGSSQTRNHSCHWPGCKAQVPPAFWGCKRHWFQLPIALRNKIWAAYEIGQEERMDPSDEYLAVAAEVQDYIEDNFGGGD